MIPSAGKVQAAASTGQQRQYRGLAEVEAAKGVLAPVLFEQRRADLEEGGGTVGAGVVHGQGERSEGLRRSDEPADVGGEADVAYYADGRRAGSLKFSGDGFNLFDRTAGDHHGIAAMG